MELEGARKRKSSSSSSTTTFPLNELNQDLLERVLSFLPTSSFFRSTSVCKKWKSIAHSPTFTLACSHVPKRDPWFLMVDSNSIIHPAVIFDCSQRKWRKLNPLFPQSQSNFNFIPVASSGGLICFHEHQTGQFLIANPVTRFTQQIEPVRAPVQAIGMLSNSDTFKLVVVSGELSSSNLTFKTYNACHDKWGPEVRLATHNNNPESVSTEYFLTKCGDVVSTNTQQSPCKQFSSLMTVSKENEQVLYFLSPSGSILCCNLTQETLFEYPRLLPVSCEYSIDIVELDGDLCVVLLLEMFESASVRVWKWDKKGECWRQIAKMPDWMSQKYYGKKVDVNCSGAGEQMLVCLNSSEICSYVVYILGEDEWIEFDGDDHNGEGREFVCGYSFEPRIEASICKANSPLETL